MVPLSELACEFYSGGRVAICVFSWNLLDKLGLYSVSVELTSCLLLAPMVLFGYVLSTEFHLWLSSWNIHMILWLSCSYDLSGERRDFGVWTVGYAEGFCLFYFGFLISEFFSESVSFLLQIIRYWHWMETLGGFPASILPNTYLYQSELCFQSIYF